MKFASTSLGGLWSCWEKRPKNGLAQDIRTGLQRWERRAKRRKEVLGGRRWRACAGGPGQCGAAGSRRRLSRMIHCLHTAPSRQPAPGGVAWRSRQNIFWLISPTRKKNIITFISGSSFSQRWQLEKHLQHSRPRAATKQGVKLLS